MLDTKAVMRSMRLGSEDFDRNYNAVVLGGRCWKDILGQALIPDVITASRQHVLRSDFAPYDFSSAASLLRFTANTIGHFEELKLGLQLSKVAFLDAILALFPALVPVCYHYLAAYPSLHVRNRDSELVCFAPIYFAFFMYRLSRMTVSVSVYIQGCDRSLLQSRSDQF
jgi:hypothetical protein